MRLLAIAADQQGLLSDESPKTVGNKDQRPIRAICSFPPRGKILGEAFAMIP